MVSAVRGFDMVVGQKSLPCGLHQKQPKILEGLTANSEKLDITKSTRYLARVGARINQEMGFSGK